MADLPCKTPHDSKAIASQFVKKEPKSNLYRFRLYPLDLYWLLYEMVHRQWSHMIQPDLFFRA